MTSVKRMFGTVAGLVVFLGCLSPAHAQATRTWVSGVGDDVNPCSRTAPCKTFAGAISKTATNGEINVLDPGGFGAVTITKSITISSEGFEAGVLVSGTNGIICNAPAGSVIVLRGLDIEGLATGLEGIRFIGAGTLHVERCTINRFTKAGLNFAPTVANSGIGTDNRLFIKDTIFRNNNTANTSNTGAVTVAPAAGINATASLDGVRVENTFNFGVLVLDRSKVTIRNSVAANNSNTGFGAAATAVAGELNLENCVATGNSIGIRAVNSFSTVRISRCTAVSNGTGLKFDGGAGNGVILSSVNNSILGNGVDGTTTATKAQQ